MTCNIVKLFNLEILGVEPSISRLFMSKNDGDSLIAWELIKDHPNCEYIRVYCKGSTNTIPELKGWFDKYGKKYYHIASDTYDFGDIKIEAH